MNEYLRHIGRGLAMTCITAVVAWAMMGITGNINWSVVVLVLVYMGMFLYALDHAQILQCATYLCTMAITLMLMWNAGVWAV